MNLRPFDAEAGDADRLARFRCSTGVPFEEDVEAWICHGALSEGRVDGTVSAAARRRKALDEMTREAEEPGLYG